MNYGKAVEEVWTWREAVAKELQNVPREKRARYLNETAQEACKKLGIKCRVLPPRARVKEHA
jgi:vacuolar-type H+-ATPase subunit E/Vma4